MSNYKEPKLTPEQFRALMDGWNDGVFENRKRLDAQKKKKATSKQTTKKATSKKKK